jgi:hypothetical protein
VPRLRTLGLMEFNHAEEGDRRRPRLRRAGLPTLKRISDPSHRRLVTSTGPL